MWIEIQDNEGNYLGAVNSEACDLIRIANNDPEDGALIRNAATNEVYRTIVPYKILVSIIAPRPRPAGNLITPA